MIQLRHDKYMRHPARLQAGDGRADGFRPGLLFVLVFVSIALLFLSRLQHVYVTELRLQLAELMAPVLKAALVPLEPIRRTGQRIANSADMFSELDRLRAENQRLRGWEWRAIETERKIEQLGRLVGVIDEPGLAFATARVVSDSSGPFVRSAMLGMGRENGMRAGYPVINASGLVGRIVEAGARVARVLLVTDINSRIPVQIGKAGVRAVLLGDNGSAPQLGYLSSVDTIEVGDEVFTSGTGGLFPRGLRIGAVIADGLGFRMVPHANPSELDFVSVLFFQSPALELADEDKPIRSRSEGQRDSVARKAVAGAAASDHGISAP